MLSLSLFQAVCPSYHDSLLRQVQFSQRFPERTTIPPVTHLYPPEGGYNIEHATGNLELDRLMIGFTETGASYDVTLYADDAGVARRNDISLPCTYD